MFGFFRRPAPRPLTDAIRRAIEKDGMTRSVSNLSQLQMVELKGRYADRKVAYFRIFDPTTAAQSTLEVRRYQDFDVFPGRVLRSGHVEADGVVVLTRPVIARPADTLSRTHADRTLHADDAHIVRGETGASPNPFTVATTVSGQAP